MRTYSWSALLLLGTAIPAFAGKLVSSPNGKCGGATGFTCKQSFYGGCCGVDGFCGSTADKCGQGCQGNFGYCAGSKRSENLLEKRTISCPSANNTVFTASNGDFYTIECGIDHSGGSLPNTGQYMNSLDDCINSCATTTNCVDVSWVKGTPQGACYLKSTVGTAKANSGIWGGKFLAKAGSNPVSSSSVAPSATVSQGTGTPTETTLPTATASLCPALNNTIYQDTCGAQYVIECGIDHSGGTLAGTAPYTSSLKDCIALCSSNSACVDVSWVRGSPSGACYLKGSLGAAKANSGIFGGRQISACTVASSSSITSSATLSTSASITASASLTPSNSANATSSTVPTNTTCSTAPTLTAGTIPGCVPCQGQPGNDKFCGFDINTDWYQNTPKTCNVITYEFDITNTTASPDGVERLVMLVNGQMPGPTIKASWGDTVVVKVNNKLQTNGTSIHFHGVRQLNNNMNDGVPSITQCPIAPGESMTYTWVADNYGTSWYHSHFAIQAWEGVLGPIVIDGPHSATFDIDAGTFLLQDWSHFTVDSRYDLAQNATPLPDGSGGTFGGPVLLDNGLINGKNVWNGDNQNSTPVGERLEMTFEPNKSYLLRVINSAIQSTYKFYIDGHNFTVISNDFVPIQPYTTNILNINIGQRYNIIVNTNQAADNYWMRADNQNACAGTVQGLDIKAIVRYSNAPTGTLPTSTAYNYTTECVDEPYASLIPVVPINAGAPDFTEGTLDVVVQANSAQLFKWYLSGTTFFSEYNDPTLLDIQRNNSVPDYSGNLLVKLPNAKEWVYVIVESPIPLPHPLHLHGHDFAILAEGPGSYDSSVVLNLNNPPRRDTALLPAAGYIVLAFETDNPGVWLMHCHIGWHTSMGFALQFVEMQDQIASSGALNNSCTLTGTCKSWIDYATANDIVVADSGV